MYSFFDSVEEVINKFQNLVSLTCWGHMGRQIIQDQYYITWNKKWLTALEFHEMEFYYFNSKYCKAILKFLLFNF